MLDLIKVVVVLVLVVLALGLGLFGLCVAAIGNQDEKGWGLLMMAGTALISVLVIPAVIRWRRPPRPGAGQGERSHADDR